jgi:hypothetical protein
MNVLYHFFQHAVCRNLDSHTQYIHEEEISDLTADKITHWADIKGQLISKANFQAIDSPKKRTDEFPFLT